MTTRPINLCESCKKNKHVRTFRAKMMSDQLVYDEYEYCDMKFKMKDLRSFELADGIHVVKSVCDRFLSGFSLSNIVTWLENKGIDTKKGKRWDKKTISRMLSNPVYCGLIEWDDIIVPGLHSSAITRKTFNSMQRTNRHRARRKGTNFIITADLQKVNLQ